MLRREAARWLARLQSGPDPQIERNFRRWYEADPAHAEAFDRVRRTYEQAGLLRHSATTAPGISRDRPEQTARPQRYALAAAVALVVLVPSCLLLVASTGLPFGPAHATILATNVGEIRQVTLSDGSRLILDTATRVEVEVGESQRRALLRHGRARIQIAAAREPFVIEAGAVTATSDEGVLDVQRSGEQSRVDVLSGTADVEMARGGTEAVLKLRSHQAVTANSSGQQTRHPATASADWPKGMLQFDGTPVGAAVNLANRYSQRRIILSRDLRQLRVTGAFRAGDTTGLARALAQAFNLSISETTDGNLMLSPVASSARTKKERG